MSRVDVVVVTYRSAGTVAAALQSVREHPAVARITVVDNHSPDESAAVAGDAGADDVMANGVNLGFARAVDQGLAAGDASFVLLLNPDARLEPEALELLIGALDDDRDAVMAGPLLVEQDGTICLGAHRFATVANRLYRVFPLTRRRAWGPFYGDDLLARSAGRPVPVDYLWGASLLCRRDFLVGVGGLDERFFLYSEDEDLGRQARRAGKRSLLVPAARARHVGGHSSRGMEPLAEARLQYAVWLLLTKWEGPRAAAVFRWGALMGYALRALLARVRGHGTAAAAAVHTRAYLARMFEGADPANGR